MFNRREINTTSHISKYLPIQIFFNMQKGITSNIKLKENIFKDRKKWKLNLQIRLEQSAGFWLKNVKRAKLYQWLFSFLHKKQKQYFSTTISLCNRSGYLKS